MSTRIILLTMVKNESRIIWRLLTSVIATGCIDAVVICDTGSTDDTIAVATACLSANKMRGTIFSFPFQTFGESRTTSFRCCVEYVRELGWDPAICWALLMDGDMTLPAAINRAALEGQPPTVAGLYLAQANGDLVYQNVRLLRCSELWNCVGSTHEAWSCPSGKLIGQLPAAPMILDHNDGGCKADKFDRDVVLLQNDLATTPDDPRTLFYLGQTYMCLKDWPNAIATLKKRITVGGWDEETYIAELYQGDCLEASGRGADAVTVWLSAWARRQHRTEAALRLITYYRTQPTSQFIAGLFLEKLFAIQFGKSLVTGEVCRQPMTRRDTLFVNRRDLDYTIWMELALVGYYVGLKAQTWLYIDELDVSTAMPWADFNRIFMQIHWYDWLLRSRRVMRIQTQCDSIQPTATDIPATDGEFRLRNYCRATGHVPWVVAGTNEAWLLVIHTACAGDGEQRDYHRFMTLDASGHPLRVSCWVRMTRERIERWSRIAPTERGDGYWVTYGLRDSDVYVAELATADIERLLFYHFEGGQPVPFCERLRIIESVM